MKQDLKASETGAPTVIDSRRPMRCAGHSASEPRLAGRYQERTRWDTCALLYPFSAHDGPTIWSLPAAVLRAVNMYRKKEGS
jgi:hypothetical protein